MLCQFARTFPPRVAEILERGRQFKRRLREETITDIMMVELQSLGSDQIIVDFPDEPTTGADMEWNFVNRTNHTFYRLLLQAKCAYGNNELLSRHTYKYLSHRTAGRYQADILCEAARNARYPTYPLYIFYNPAHTCVAARDVEGPMIEGVNLADGYSIRSFATTGRRHIPGIRPYIHSLTTLFCPPDNHARIPRPADVRDYLMHRASMSFRLPEEILKALDADDHIMIPPEVGTAIPEDVLARIERTPAPGEGRSTEGAGMRLIASAPVCTVLFTAIASAGTLADCGAPALMSDGWPMSPPAQQGLDPQLICSIGPGLAKATEADPHGVVVIRHGVLFYEAYFTGEDMRGCGRNP